MSKSVLPRTGKRKISFCVPRRKVNYEFVQLPCDGCVGCKFDRSRHWAVRLLHEAQMSIESCFVTLTYRDEDLPAFSSLCLSDFQKFMKRLRKTFVPKCPWSFNKEFKKDWYQAYGIRFFHAGEYGELSGRPHYHVIIFGLDFPDKYQWRVSKSGNMIFRSPTLEKLWTFGHSEIGSVTFESAAYVARYCVKKVLSDVNVGSNMSQEYVTMSRKPGIGKDWFDKYGTSDVFPQDFIQLHGGGKCSVPRFYDNQFELVDKLELDKVKARRVERASGNPDNSPSRLRDREQVQLAKAKILKRSL